MNNDNGRGGKLMGLPQVAEYTGLRAYLLRRLIGEKKLPAVKVGRLWYMRRSDVDRIVDGRGDVVEIFRADMAG